MNKMKKSLSIVMTICALICWWGYFFPELTLTPDTVQVIEISGDQAPVETAIERATAYHHQDYEDIYHRLLTAKPEEIRIRCRLFDTLSSYWEAFQNGSD